jgi:hypothetical protein
MNRAGLLFDQLHDAEVSLAADYRKVGERHAPEHDMWHNCHTFARQCEARAADIRLAGERYGKYLSQPHEVEAIRSLAAHARRAVADLVGRRPATGLLLLGDLRHLYLAAEEANVHWLMLGQVAQASRDARLLEVVEMLHRQLLSQIKWLKSQIKEATPQILLA